MDIESLEVKLYSYYSDLNKEGYYRNILQELKQELEIITEKIRNREFEVEIKSKSIEYGLNVQSSNDCSSIEKAIITGEQELINAYYKLKTEVVELSLKIMDIEYDKVVINGRMELLDYKYKSIIQDVYKNKMKVPKYKRIRALEEFNKYMSF